MQYEGNIIRPPSEAHSIILQVTTGCSHNKCTFCGAYKDKTFRVRSESLQHDLEFAAEFCSRQKRVFLADGDALILPQDQLVSLLNRIRHKLPWVNRVSLYANGKAVRSKTTVQLRELKKLGLDRIYMGLESGDDQILHRIQKGETSRAMIEAAHVIREVGLFLSVTILLGIGGVHHSPSHANATAEVLNSMAPNQIAALTLMVLANTPLYDDMIAGHFILPDSRGILQELRKIIDGLHLDHVQFFTNHASNYLHLSGRLQKDKVSFLKKIDKALQGETPLMAEERRSL